MLQGLLGNKLGSCRPFELGMHLSSPNPSPLNSRVRVMGIPPTSGAQGRASGPAELGAPLWPLPLSVAILILHLLPLHSATSLLLPQ